MYLPRYISLVLFTSLVTAATTPLPPPPSPPNLRLLFCRITEINVVCHSLTVFTYVCLARHYCTVCICLGVSLRVSKAFCSFALTLWSPVVNICTTCVSKKQVSFALMFGVANDFNSFWNIMPSRLLNTYRPFEIQACLTLIIKAYCLND
jgi:hypothetical protein